jgi:hypothetical protein
MSAIYFEEYEHTRTLKILRGLAIGTFIFTLFASAGVFLLPAMASIVSGEITRFFLAVTGERSKRSWTSENYWQAEATSQQTPTQKRCWH